MRMHFSRINMYDIGVCVHVLMYVSAPYVNHHPHLTCMTHPKQSHSTNFNTIHRLICSVYFYLLSYQHDSINSPEDREQSRETQCSHVNVVLFLLFKTITSSSCHLLQLLSTVHRSSADLHLHTQKLLSS